MKDEPPDLRSAVAALEGVLRGHFVAGKTKLRDADLPQCMPLEFRQFTDAAIQVLIARGRLGRCSFLLIWNGTGKVERRPGDFGGRYDGYRILGSILEPVIIEPLADEEPQTDRPRGVSLRDAASAVNDNDSEPDVPMISGVPTTIPGHTDLLELAEVLTQQQFKIVSFLLNRAKQSAFWSDLPTNCWTSAATPEWGTAKKAFDRLGTKLSEMYARFGLILRLRPNGIIALETAKDKSLDNSVR